ncbi:ParB/Srx family N-terminal domain-containing protein [Microbacterium candidum]|uniref:ParB/Srx family N-terminal domain-containing protein n=1 Tax=Microbacterium candidum TaxID=3041922 RepID=A0ABT7MYS5_9MICO|nr:ParB/Srx family N-terminal domain-containing protein [Microbacterium sp. ASV49]MDL9979577.1 ParB/Srx family N-terminal domain-containing protein [Microbacterium sp. ASV49]
MTTRTIRRILQAALATALIGAGALVAAPAQAAPKCPSPSDAARPNYMCAQVGDLVDVRIGDVHPTQPSLGYDEVYYKLGRYTLGKDAVNKKFDDWCEANGQGQAATVAPYARLDDPASFTCTIPVGQETEASIEPMKTVVIGPGGKLYLSDGHHTLTSFYELADGGPNLHVRLRVLGNLSGLGQPQFWAAMQANGWTWLKDAHGEPISPKQLPSSVGLANFQDDTYRSLLYFARDIGYSADSVPFQEFYWGDWVRTSGAVDLTGWDRDDLASYLAAVKTLSLVQTSLAPSTVISGGFTAAQLDVLPAWNNGAAAAKGEFGKLSKPYTDAKPGKLAYALAFKALHGITSGTLAGTR